MTVLTHPDMILDDAEVITSYTRADALRDGVLVDVTRTARKVGFRHRVAITQSVWLDSVHWDAEVDARKAVECVCQDTDIRLHDLLWAALLAVRASSGRRSATIVLSRVPVTTPGPHARDITLLVSIGPGDRGEPVITISMPDEV